MVGVVDNSQRGSSERVREKMVKKPAGMVGERQVEEALSIEKAAREYKGQAQ